MTDQQKLPLEFLTRVSGRIAYEYQEAQREKRPLSAFEVAKALYEDGYLAVPGEEPTRQGPRTATDEAIAKIRRIVNDPELRVLVEEREPGRD